LRSGSEIVYLMLTSDIVASNDEGQIANNSLRHLFYAMVVAQDMFSALIGICILITFIFFSRMNVYQTVEEFDVRNTLSNF
jgi:hypothetical protein